MPKGKKKDKYDLLDEEFKDAIAQSSTDEIRKRVAEIALLDVNMKAALKADPDVEQAKDALSELMQPYRDDLKIFRTKIEYCNAVLEAKGGGAGK